MKNAGCMNIWFTRPALSRFVWDQGDRIMEGRYSPFWLCEDGQSFMLWEDGVFFWFCALFF